MAIFRGAGGSIDGLVTPTTIPVTTSQGGTGATTANAGLNNLLPTQGGQAGKYLKTDGTNTAWDALELNTADVTGFLPVSKGGTGASNATEAQNNLGLEIGVDIPANDGTGATGTWAISVSGNAATATDGLVSTGSYADPSWITSLAGSKVSGDIAGNAGSVTNGVYTNGSYADPAFITSLAGSKVTGNISGNAANVSGTVAVANGGTGATTAANARVSLLPSYSGNALKVLSVNAGGTDVEWSTSSGVGTVTSVGMSVPTGLSVSGSPVTTAGTLAVSYASGYSIPTDANQSNWNTAYGWGNHASAGYALDNAVVKLTGDQTVGGTKTFSSTVTGSISGNAGTVTNGVYTTGDQTIGGTKTFSSTITGSISGNAGTATNGVVTTGSYADPTWITSIAGSKVSGNITGNAGTATALATGRTISATGDVAYTSGSFDGTGNVTGTATLATVNSNTGSFGSSSSIPVVTVNAKGLVTAVSTATVAGGQYFGTAATKAIAYNSNSIAEDITITTGNNAFSVGSITISSGFSVTVQSGSRWVVL